MIKKTTQPLIEFGISYKQCERRYMEDYTNYYFNYDKDIYFFNICDGHGGSTIASFINQNFITELINVILRKEIKYNSKLNIEQIKKYIYNIVNNLDNRTKQFPCYKVCGTTFTSILIYNGIIYSINIGDSVTLFNKQNKIFFKTRPHNPNDKKEKKRILQKSYITKNNRIEGVINLSRAFGDYNFKKYTNDFNPIISTPDIKEIKLKDFLNNNDKPWILLSSDGLYCLIKENFVHKIINVLFSINYTCQEISKFLIQYCNNNKNPDNVSIVLFRFSSIKQNNKLTNLIKNIKTKIIVNIIDDISKQHTHVYDNEEILKNHICKLIKENILYFKLNNELLFIFNLIKYDLTYEIIKFLKIKNFIPNIN